MLPPPTPQLGLTGASYCPIKFGLNDKAKCVTEYSLDCLSHNIISQSAHAPKLEHVMAFIQQIQEMVQREPDKVAFCFAV